MCFDGSGGHAPPAARRLFPDSAGRSVPSIPFSLRLGQRGIAPFRARPRDEPRRQVELADGHVLHAVRVQQRLRVGAEHRPEGAGGRREAERAAGLGVHVRHRQRQVRRGQPVEPEAAALGGCSKQKRTTPRTSRAPSSSSRSAGASTRVVISHSSSRKRRKTPAVRSPRTASFRTTPLTCSAPWPISSSIGAYSGVASA